MARSTIFSIFDLINGFDNFDDPEMISPETLLRDADTAMFYAKKLGSPCNKVFDISMRERELERLQLEIVNTSLSLRAGANLSALTLCSVIISLSSSSILQNTAMIKYSIENMMLTANDVSPIF